MKKLCPKHGAYPAKQARCPQCKRDYWATRESAEVRGYDSDWRQFRRQLMADPLYGFCWLTLIEEGRLESTDLQYHHIAPIRTHPELRLERDNIAPITAARHNSLEQSLKKGAPQPDWGAVREQVKQRLGAL